MTLFVSVLGVLRTDAATQGWVERVTLWASSELQALDLEKLEIAQELKTLPTPAGTHSGVRRGFQTGRVRKGEDPWVELELPTPSEAESVVLVPMLGKGARGVVPGFGFPSRFQLEARDEEGGVHLLMDETARDFPNPGYYPLQVPCPPGVKIARVRLTATEPWNQGGPEALALAEMLVVSGNRNLAIGGKVSASSSREMWPTWSTRNLIDMAMPLGLPVAPAGVVPLGWRTQTAKRSDDKRLVMVDLGGEFDLDEIQLAPAWQPGVSGSYNLGFPSRFAVVTATDKNFKDQKLVLGATEESQPVPGQNLQCIPVGGIPVRYISVVATKLRDSAGNYLFALGELRAFQGNQDVARGAKVISGDSVEDDEWSADYLTDGLAGGGRILELGEWFEGMDRRREVEARLAEIDVRRGELLGKSEHLLVNGSIGTTACLAIGGVFFGWRSKRQRRIDRERHRERLARDLHDELGSNLGSIALISSFALEGESDENQMRGDMAEIELVARESADSMRDLVELLGGRHRGAGSDWLSVLEGMAERMLRGIELDCALAEEPWLHQPDLESRREIYLFCKEVLHNASRHADATKVHFAIDPTPSGLRVLIRDNGRGFDPSTTSDGHGLSNLRERAEGLRATMDLVSTRGEGTVVTIDVPRGRRWRKRKEKKSQ